MKIGTNIASLTANLHLAKTENRLAKSMERLSSGFKINRSEDDSAGMAISETLRTQIKALERSNQNSNDAISVSQTAEGALGEVHSILQRMRELAVQGASDSYTDEDRASIDLEIKALAEEIDRISTDTEFNNQPLLDGNFQRRCYTDTEGTYITDLSDGVTAGEYSITVTADATQATASSGAVAATTTEKGTVKINGVSVEIQVGESRDEVYEKLRDAADKSKVTVTQTPGGMFDFTSEYYGSEQKIEISCANADLARELGLQGIIASSPITGQDATISLGTGFSPTAQARVDGTKITITDRSGFSMTYKIPADLVASSATGSATVKGDVTDMGTLVVQLGANEGQTLHMIVPEVSCETLGLEKLNYQTGEGCSKAIGQIDEAISYVSSTRAKLGAYQNRLEATMASLEVTTENLTSSLSKIYDTDMAKEMTEFTSLNVLQQAGTSMLSQANQLPEKVLQLLQ